MAKRKLYGAALAAHQRKLGHHRATTTALVRRSSTAIAAKPKTRKVYIKVKAKRRRGGGGGSLAVGSGINGAIATLKHQAPMYGAAAVYGYLTANDDQKAIDLRTKTLDHLPTSAKLGKPLSHGLLLTGAASLMPPGMLRKATGYLAFAAMMRAGHNFGAAGGDTDKFATMSGDDEADFSGGVE